MEIRFQNSPAETKKMSTGELRANFLCEALMQQDKLTLVYSHYDRIIIGGVKPVNETITLENQAELKADHFLERRETGIINVSGPGKVIADGQAYDLGKLDCIYIGKGVKDVRFSSVDQDNPAAFFLLSAPAHHSYPTTIYTKEQAAPVDLGAPNTSNERTIYKYIHADGIQSCQLVMGLTVLKQGSVWNSVPPHTHTRRMEVYFYFDVPQDQRVFHMMGEPTETRHLIMKDHEAVIAAPWSVHFGCGTANYSFIWGMAGENKQFTDMDPAPVSELR
jgi:4-deoxy-L-threo-5-hexosulose-uronate ketol-isomerase